MSINPKHIALLAFGEATTIIVGLGLFATSMSDYATGDLTAAESAAFVADNEELMYVWNTITLLVFAILLVPLVLALHQRLAPRGSAVAASARVFGLIWAGLLLAGGMITNIGLGVIADLQEQGDADVSSVWSALDAVQNGLTGGIEIVGGLWILLVSLAALQSGALPAAQNYLGLVMGATALATIVPALELVGAVFGLGLIVWFVWLGIVMMRAPAQVTETGPAKQR